MCGFLIAAALFVVCAAVPYLVVEKAWRWRWQELEVGRMPAVAGGGVFRDGGDVPRYATRAPASVRVVALSSLLIGQLFVPLTVAGALGLVVFGLGLFSIPALVATARLYRAGLSLLRRDPRVAYFRAREAATWTLCVGGVTLALDVAAMLTIDARDLHDLIGVPLVMVAIVCVVAVVHALALRLVIRAAEEQLFAASQKPTVVL